MKLFELTWGIYPRRVSIYLAEKGLELERVSIDVVAGQNKEPEFLKISPSGQLPVLQLDNGDIITQSAAIINYLEELHPAPSLSGSTPLEKARTTEFMSLINDAYIYFNQYTGHASPVFQQRLTQSAETADAMYDSYRAAMRQIDGLMANSGTFLCGETVTYADCALFASAQFAEELYKSSIPVDCPRIKRFYDQFSTRESAAVPIYPPQIVGMTPVPPRA